MVRYSHKIKRLVNQAIKVVPRVYLVLFMDGIFILINIKIDLEFFGEL